MPHTLVVGLGAACELAVQEMDVSVTGRERVRVWCGVVCCVECEGVVWSVTV